MTLTHKSWFAIKRLQTNQRVVVVVVVAKTAEMKMVCTICGINQKEFFEPWCLVLQNVHPHRLIVYWWITDDWDGIIRSQIHDPFTHYYNLLTELIFFFFSFQKVAFVYYLMMNKNLSLTNTCIDIKSIFVDN